MLDGLTYPPSGRTSPHRAMKSESNGYRFQIENTWRTSQLGLQPGLRITEVPITFTDRKAGESEMSSRDRRRGVASRSAVALV